MPDDTTEKMTQEGIDDYIASAVSKEEDQHTQAADQGKSKPGSLSQNNIDTWVKQQPEQKASPGIRQNSGAASQSEIDELVAHELQEQLPHADQTDSEEISQSDDPVKKPHREEELNSIQSQELCRNNDDTFFDPEQKESSQSDGNIWEDMGSDILSQDEINALLTGMNELDGVSACPTGIVSEGQEIEDSDQPHGNSPGSRKSAIEIQKEKEEKIINKKLRASAMIRGLLKKEEERLADLETRKEKMVNTELYARYEITRADRSKITVSMSKKTAEQYCFSHPDCTILKI